MFRVRPDTVELMSLYPGRDLTEEEIGFLENHAGVRANAAAARILGRRSYSEAEIRAKLAQQAYTQEEIDEAVAELTDFGMIDDRAYALAVIESYVERLCSPRAIRYELLQRGLDRELVEELIEELPPCDDILDTVLDRRLRGAAPERTLFDKTFRYLMGKGFESGDIRAALARYRERVEEEE